MSYILLIEDNPGNAELMIRLLETAGYEVKHYVKGMEGVQKAFKERPSLILLDFNLPDVDGRSLILTLKKRLGGADAPPIVAVTARTGIAEEAIAESFGCDAFVRKPFDPEEFVKLVSDYVNSESTK